MRSNYYPVLYANHMYPNLQLQSPITPATHKTATMGTTGKKSYDFPVIINTVAEGQGNTVGVIVFVYSDQISTIISNKIR